MGKSLYCPPLLWNLLDSLHFSFVSLCRIQAQVGCFFLIRMQSTWCSRGLSGLVAIRDEFWRQAVGWNQLARPSSKSPLCLMAFPLLWGSTYLCVFSEGWVWKKSLLPAVSERGPVVGKVVGSPWRNCCSK